MASASPSAVALVACSERPPGDDDALVAPTDVTATAKAGSIVVNWSDNSTGELGFRVFRQTFSADDDTVLATNQVAETAANVTQYTDADVAESNRYSYLVAAFDESGMSERTEQQGEPVAPVAPRQVRPRHLDGGDDGEDAGDLPQEPVGGAVVLTCGLVGT